MFVMPSTGEGLGIVSLEAMACGIPALGGDTDGSVDPLSSSPSGKAVPPEQLADSIAQFLEHPPRTNQPCALVDPFGREAFATQLSRLTPPSPQLEKGWGSPSERSMNRILPEASWPPSWRYSYAYDLQEIYGEMHNPGYVYAYQNRRDATLQLIEEVLPEGSSILDVAAAQGNFTLALAERGYRVTWNDLRQELEGYVRLKYERGDVSFAPGSVFELNFESAFDCVLITEIIEHVAHPDQFLQKIASMARPGGYIIMTTPNGAYFRNKLPRFSECSDPAIYEKMQFKPDSDGHIFLLWPHEVRRLAAECQLEIQKQILFTNSLTAGHVKTARLLSFLPRSAVFRMESVIARLPNAVNQRLMVQTSVRLQKPTEPLGFTPAGQETGDSGRVRASASC